MKRWMEERGQEERRRKDESIISLIRQTPLHYDTLHTHNRIWAHIRYQIWACHGRSYNTVVMYVNKHTQENYGNKTHHQQTKTNIGQCHQATLDNDSYLLIVQQSLPPPVGLGSEQSYAAQLHQKFCVLLVADV